MKRIRIYFCAFLFVALTAIKLVAPAVAADMRTVMIGKIERSDDYASVGTTLRSALDGSRTQPLVQEETEPYKVDMPLESMEQNRASHQTNLFLSLPASQLHTSPSAEVEAELSHAAALDAAYAVREAFLESQSAFSDRALPTNVSYEIFELPFSTVSPVTGYTSSGFGYRMHPIKQTVKFHYGTDFAAGSGTDICAFAAGTVLAAGQDAGYGNYIKIDHGDGFVTLYGHCSALLAHEGDAVAAGQVIARVGATGQATGPHLHFELIHNGTYLNPEFYLAV